MRHHPDTAVLVLTMFESEEYVLAALRAGARGYLVKGSGMREIAQAIIGVANGQATFGPSVAARVLAYFGEPDHNAPPPPFPQLTEREREVLSLLARDLGNIVIARRLGIEPKTVRNYVSGIIVKLQVADREEAARRAREAGLGG